MNRVRMTMVAATVLVGVTAAAAGARLSAWGAPQKVDEVAAGNHADLNTPSLDGCPIQSPDGLSFYQACNEQGRPGRARHLGGPRDPPRARRGELRRTSASR